MYFKTTAPSLNSLTCFEVLIYAPFSFIGIFLAAFKPLQMKMPWVGASILEKEIVLCSRYSTREFFFFREGKRMVGDGSWRTWDDELQDWWMALLGMAPCQALMSLNTVNRRPSSPECVSVFTPLSILSISAIALSLSSAAHLICWPSSAFAPQLSSPQEQATSSNAFLLWKAVKNKF